MLKRVDASALFFFTLTAIYCMDYNIIYNMYMEVIIMGKRLYVRFDKSKDFSKNDISKLLDSMDLPDVWERTEDGYGVVARLHGGKYSDIGNYRNSPLIMDFAHRLEGYFEKHPEQEIGLSASANKNHIFHMKASYDEVYMDWYKDSHGKYEPSYKSHRNVMYSFEEDRLLDTDFKWTESQKESCNHSHGDYNFHLVENGREYYDAMSELEVTHPHADNPHLLIDDYIDGYNRAGESVTSPACPLITATDLSGRHVLLINTRDDVVYTGVCAVAGYRGQMPKGDLLENLREYFQDSSLELLPFVKERIEKEQEAENIAETKGLVTDEGLDPDEDVLE